MTTENDLSNNLLEYYLKHGAKACATRFKISDKLVVAIMREVGVPLWRKGKGGRPTVRPERKRLATDRRAALRAEYVPGKRGEIARLSVKYGVTTQGVAYLTKHLRAPVTA